VETTRRKTTEVFPPLISQAEIDSAGAPRQASPACNERSIPTPLWVSVGMIFLSLVTACTIQAM